MVEKKKAQDMKKIDLFNDKLNQEQKGVEGAAALLRLHMKRNREMIDLTPFTDKQKEKTYRTNKKTERQTDEGKKKKSKQGRGGGGGRTNLQKNNTTGFLTTNTGV